MIGSLPDGERERLRAAPFTYPEVGATLDGHLPDGYHHLDRARAMPGADLERVAEGLMRWGLQEGAGLAVSVSAPRAEEGAVVLMRLGPPRLGLDIPCRVVALVREPDRIGFAYGTLPDHPECGEELFVAQQTGAGVEVRIRAFSRPGTRLSRAVGPVGRVAQRLMTTRYLAAAARF